MDKLYTALFGVFMTSTDDDFNNFIEVVKSVLTDKPSYMPGISKGTTWWLVIIAVAVVMCLVFFLMMYLKAIRRN
ncbi:m39L [Myxoma virus]|uniref:M39L n=2 Tax=Myxoma virus TaxID=10273 RepID=Q9Q8Q7_MYXVL|nr:m39L [Myxoma virus]ACB28833.1 m39L [recombinant virus 6918VP60-T2]AAF14927.1 m39L [Myxoma virus]ACB28662.1 m39L [Myxoma virus]ADK63679.1 m39L [Myxoma virus]AFU76971.1 m39L [Myxoma virus]